ncbi:MAG: hypothetical protein V5A55_06310 [Halovenus sp.]
MNTLDRSPTPVSSALSALMGVVVLAASGPYATLAAGLAALGLVVLLAGLFVGTHRLTTSGCSGLFVGAVAGGIEGAPILVTLVGVTGAVLAWDFAGYAIDLGVQLGHDADATRLELVHATGSVVVGTGVGGVGFLVYLAATGGQPVSAVFAFLLAAVFLLAALRHLDPVVS